MAHSTTMREAFDTAYIGYNNVTQGNCVRNVQLYFRWHKPSVEVFVDGYWDPNTMQGVKDFQSSNSTSPVDGVVGNDTKAALWEQYEDLLREFGYMVFRYCCADIPCPIKPLTLLVRFTLHSK